MIVLVVSLPLFALGIILIPLPGPGLLVSLLALVILSLEFEGARKYRDKVLNQLRAIFAKAKAKSESYKQ